MASAVVGMTYAPLAVVLQKLNAAFHFHGTAGNIKYGFGVSIKALARSCQVSAKPMALITVDQLSTTIQRLKSEGMSILMAEQNLNFARTNCDRAYILYQGRIQHQSSIAELSQEAYEQYCAL
jgi:hypothetical protein